MNANGSGTNEVISRKFLGRTEEDHEVLRSRQTAVRGATYRPLPREGQRVLTVQLQPLKNKMSRVQALNHDLLRENLSQLSVDITDDASQR